MNKRLYPLVSLIIVSVLLPQIASAAWWNPLTWSVFSRLKKPVPQTEVIKITPPVIASVASPDVSVKKIIEQTPPKSIQKTPSNKIISPSPASKPSPSSASEVLTIPNPIPPTLHTEEQKIEVKSLALPIIETDSVFKNQCGGITLLTSKKGLLLTNKSCTDIEHLMWDELTNDSPINTLFLAPFINLNKSLVDKYKGYAVTFQDKYANSGLFYRDDGKVTYVDSFSTDEFSKTMALYYINAKKVGVDSSGKDIWVSMDQDIVFRRFRHMLFSSSWPTQHQMVYVIYFDDNSPKAIKTNISRIEKNIIYTTESHKNAFIINENGQFMGMSPTINDDYFLATNKILEKFTEKGLSFND